MTDLQVLHEMCINNQDIAAATTVVSLDKDPRGGLITFGLSADSFNKLIAPALGGEEKHLAICYVINKEEFFKIKNRG